MAAVPGESLVRISQPGNLLSLEIQPQSVAGSLPQNWELPVASLPQSIPRAIYNRSTSGNITVSQINAQSLGSGTGGNVEIQMGSFFDRSIPSQTETALMPAFLRLQIREIAAAVL